MNKFFSNPSPDRARRLLSSIVDLNYDISNLAWKQMDRLSENRLPALFEGIARLIYMLFRSLRFWRSPQSGARIMFLIGTHNQSQSLSPIVQKSKDALALGFHHQVGSGSHVPELWFYYRGILKLGRLFSAYGLCDDDYIRQGIRRRLDRYVLSLSVVDVWERYLRIANPRVLVVSNDHNVWTRGACCAAKRLGITTVFVPHAPTGEGPPPMEFDYAFMDGRHQTMQYDTKSTHVMLAGAVRYEALLGSSRGGGEAVLICFNKMDELSFAETIIERVRNGIPDAPISVRPHPADVDRYPAFRRIASRYGAKFVSGREPLSEAIRGVGYIMAGVSGVHVDALMAGRVPLTYNDWYKGDYYGLKSMGVLQTLDPDKPFIFPSGTDCEALNRAAVLLNQQLCYSSIEPSTIIAASLSRLADGIHDPFEVAFEDFHIQRERRSGWYVIES